MEALADELQRTWYPVTMDVEYRFWNKRRERRGRGKTLNMSSSAVQFETNDTMPAGMSITLDLNWPCLLNGKCAMKLRVFGQIASSFGNQVIVRIAQHEFRTAGIQSPRKPLTMRANRPALARGRRGLESANPESQIAMSLVS